MLERNNSQHKTINSLKTPSTKKVSSHISTMDSGGVIASRVFSLVAVVFCLYGWFVDVWLAVNMLMILRSLSSHQTGGCWVKIVTHCHAIYIYNYNYCIIIYIYINDVFFWDTAAACCYRGSARTGDIWWQSEGGDISLGSQGRSSGLDETMWKLYPLVMSK